jgi:hypothetical protein
MRVQNSPRCYLGDRLACRPRQCGGRSTQARFVKTLKSDLQPAPASIAFGGLTVSRVTVTGHVVGYRKASPPTFCPGPRRRDRGIFCSYRNGCPQRFPINEILDSDTRSGVGQSRR